MSENKIDIIVVDDEADLELLYKINFEDEIDDGIVVIDFFTSGAQCLEFVSKKELLQSVLILSDINMPGMDGFELLEKVRDQYPELPVYMVSAYGDEKHIQRSKELGAKEFITKPVHFDLLKKTIFETFNLIVHN